MPSLLNGPEPIKQLEKRVLLAQEGNEEERNHLIAEYVPFVKKVLSQQMGRYIEEENDEYFSVGLMAFNESIDHFRQEKGSFLGFAASVIRNRSIDQMRKDKRIAGEIPFTAMESRDQETDAPYERLLSVPGPEETALVQEEMALLVKRLGHFGITLDELISEAPKHVDTRKKAVWIAQQIQSNPLWRQQLLKTGRMPLKELAEKLTITKKTVDRSKKFIIAVVLIMDSRLEIMKSYVYSLEEEEPS